MTTQPPLRLPPEPRWKPGQGPGRGEHLDLERLFMLAVGALRRERQENERLRRVIAQMEGGR